MVGAIDHHAQSLGQEYIVDRLHLAFECQQSILACDRRKLDQRLNQCRQRRLFVDQALLRNAEDLFEVVHRHADHRREDRTDNHQQHTFCAVERHQVAVRLMVRRPHNNSGGG